MKLAAKYQRMRQPKHGRGEEILVVHHIVERKTSVGTRRGKDLEKRAVPGVGRIRIAAAVGIPQAEPRIDEANPGLPAGFAGKGRGALRQNAPTAVLHCAPQQEVEFAVILRVEDMRVVRAVGADANRIMVRRTARRGAIVGLKHRAAFVYIAEAKK